MLHATLTWLLVAALAGAGLVNAAGSASTRKNFVHWGYPAWWCWVTGATEILVALLVLWPLARPTGLLLASLVIVAATATVVRHHDLAHLAPLALFGILIAAVILTR